MLSLKVLKGMSPQMFALKEGANIIGRAATSDIVLNSTSVSKKHAQIMVRDGQCSISDLGSSNGTFVNGMKIKDRILKHGDRIAFHEIILEVVQPRSSLNIPASPIQQTQQMPMMTNNSLAPNLFAQNQEEPIQSAPRTLSETAMFYIENTILPGIYKINESTSTKSIIAGFIFIFAIAVTMLATIPMSALMKESIQKEAQRRALTIARQLAAVSSQSMSAGNEGAIRTDFAENEDGVIAALVVSKEDGHIIAPLSKAQSYSNEEFVARARRSEESFVDLVNDKTVGASVPIKIYSSEAGQQITAFAVIIYKLNTLDWGASTGLFARVLMISLLLGFIIFYFIYRLTREPAHHAVTQLDRALRGEINFIEPKYNDETFGKLISNINSAISRMSSGGQQNLKIDYDRSLEAANLTRILNDPAISVNSQGLIISVNSHFEDLTGQRLLTIQNQTLEALQDQALKLNLEDLRLKLVATPTQIASSELEIAGALFDLDGQAISDGEKVFYVIITVKKKGGT